MSKLEEGIARLREYQSDMEHTYRFQAEEAVRMQNRIDELEDELEAIKAQDQATNMGGHKKACGITIDKEDLEIFLEMFTQLVFETRAQ